MERLAGASANRATAAPVIVTAVVAPLLSLMVKVALPVAFAVNDKAEALPETDADMAAGLLLVTVYGFVPP